METSPSKTETPKGTIMAISLWMFLTTLFLISGLVRVWPEATQSPSIGSITNQSGTASNASNVAIQKPTAEELKAMKEQQRTTILLILLLGALGAQVHAVQSFADFVGNGSFSSSWAFWYIKRPLIGALVALISYSAVVGGVMGLDSVYKTSGGNLWGLTAICLLSGLYSRMVTDKMYEVFSTLLAIKPGNQPSRKDGLENGAPKPPVVSKVEPAEVLLSAAVSLQIHGSGFSKTCKARLGEQWIELIYKSPTELELPVTGLPQSAGTHAITVTDSASGLASTSFDLVVKP